MDITKLRLRLWALCQFVYEMVTHPRGSEDSADFARARRTLLRRCVFGGHLDDRCFVSMEADFPELGRGRTLEDYHAVVTIARRHLERYLTLGRKKSGVLPGYLRAQRAHLPACAECRDFVCAAVRKDMATSREIRGMFDGMSAETKRELAEQFVPESVRQKARNSRLN